MVYLKFWSANQLGRFAGTEEVDLKRVTTSTPASALPASTPLEKQTRKLAMKQQRLALKIKQTNQKFSQASNKPTPRKRKATADYEDDDDFVDSAGELEDEEEDDMDKLEDYSDEEEDPTPRLTAKQIRAEEKLKELNSLQRDVKKTASRMRIINEIKRQAELRKQQSFMQKNAAMKSFLQRQQHWKELQRQATAKKRKHQLNRTNPAAAASSSMQEMRDACINNMEVIMQQLLEAKQKGGTKCKSKKSKKSK